MPRIVCTSGSVMGMLQDSGSMTASDRGAAHFSLGNIAWSRCAAAPVCSVMCMTKSITNTRIYSASARWDCSGWESAVSVKNGYGEIPASLPAAQTQRKTTSPANRVRPAR